MAIIIPPSLPSKASKGEELFFQSLTKLPDSFFVWYEPKINTRYPDFIILSPEFGLLIIEVKGWYFNQIITVSTNEFKISSKGEDWESVQIQKSPLRQGKDYLDKLLNELKKYGILTQRTGRYQGQLAFPIGYGSVMSNITEEQLDQEQPNFKAVLCKPQTAYRNELLTWVKKDFSAENIIERLKQMFSVNFSFENLTSDQISTIRGVIYPEVVVRVESASFNSRKDHISPFPEDAILKTLDTKQETLAKGIGDGHRIFFGVSGSGKTLLLISRAKLLLNQNPKSKILIICFNICLAAALKSSLHEDLNNSQYKYIKVTNFHNWASSEVNQLDNQAQTNFDESVGKQLLAKLSTYTNEQKWDAIFVDEAHTFVPIWFQCCVKALKDEENGNLMIVADGSQSLYKRSTFSWKEVGVKAQGRTFSKKFDLDKNYRNTQEILSAAWWLLSKSREHHELLESDEDTFPTVQPSKAIRHGEKPIIYINTKPEMHNQKIIKTIHQLKQKGLNFYEIAILYKQIDKSKQQKPQIIQSELENSNIPTYWVNQNDNTKVNYSINKEGVRIITCLSSLGLEFKAVLILWLEQFDNCTAKKESSLFDTRQLYVAMTRAQEYLYLFTSPQAKLLDNLRESSHFNIIIE